jgi:cyclophilin family peptidyl-prolyl cis-trans isomerase
MTMMKTLAKTSVTLLAVLMASVLTLTGCKKEEPPVPVAAAEQTPPPVLEAEPTATDTPADKPAEGEKPAAEAQAAEGDKPVAGEKTLVRVLTERGEITFELFDDKAPITCGSFLLLAESGFYNGVVFHRIEPGFCVQGGDPTGTGAGGPGFTIPDELRADLKHDVGMLSMAKTMAPNSGGSQFFICLGGPAATGHLDMMHSVFGKVASGMDVVKKLQVGDKMQKVIVKSLSPHAAAAKEKAKAARKPE